MAIYKCKNCGWFFTEEESVKVNTTYESYYGVSGDFNDSHSMCIDTCPECGEEELEEINIYDENDIVQWLNDLTNENNELRETIKKLKEKKNE